MSPVRRSRKSSRPAKGRIISIRVLGPVDVLVDGETAPAPLLWKKPLALALYLARSPRHARTREHLVGLLWPEQPAEKAHGSLNEALRLLRLHGSRALMTTLGDQVRLDPACLDLDVDRFDHFAKEGRWAEACALVGGEFLEGFAIAGASGVEEWLRGERDLCRRKSVAALVSYADQLMEAGDLDAASLNAQRAADLDRYSDPAARRAVRALALRGLRTEALLVYDTFAARLAVELGTRPEPETAALADRVRQGRVWRRPTLSKPQEPPSRRSPLVGRSREMARLLKAWEACRTGARAGVALILGDPGTGKSRLAEELAERARLDGGAVATVRAIEADLEEPESGLLALADGGLLESPGVAAAPATVLGTFAARLSAWGERFPNAPREGGPPLGRAFRELARAVCGERPLLLVVDDAQWLDGKSWQALAATLRDLAKKPCFLLGTAAAHPPRLELDELRSRWGREGRATTVSIKALPREDLVALARWALPSYEAADLDRVTRRIATDSAGLPLLAVELLQAVASGLELRGITTAWPEPFRTLNQTLPGDLPDAVIGAIRVNYRRLSPDAQSALATLAVLGGRVPGTRLGQVAELAPGALQVALDELEWHRWVTAEPRGYALVARVTGEVVARDMVAPGRRQRILEQGAELNP